MNPIVWGEPETAYLRRFFDGVDEAITAEMQAGKALLEDNLTFLLGRLLDGESTFQRVLGYPLSDLNRDLAACGTGHEVSVEFATNEHTRQFESSVSFADLGIVIRREHSVFGPADTKALLVQSKKLYPEKNGYRLFSRYGGFDRTQYENLRHLAQKHDWSGVAYFLYNPRLDAFAEDDRAILSAIEARLHGNGRWGTGFPMWHPEFEFLLHRMARRGFWPVTHHELASGSSSPDELRDARNALLAKKPGLRVMGMPSVQKLVEHGKSVRTNFSLQDCYEYAFSTHWMGSDAAVPFLPLSAYLVDMLLGCTHGSRKQEIVEIASGRMPAEDTVEDTPGVAVRHVLTVTVRSTLPQRDITLRRE